MANTFHVISIRSGKEEVVGKIRHEDGKWKTDGTNPAKSYLSSAKSTSDATGKTVIEVLRSRQYGSYMYILEVTDEVPA